MAKFGFDVTEVSPDFDGGQFIPIPAGEYVLRAVEADEETTRSGTGTFMKVMFEVTKGEYTKRRIWHNFTMTNKSEQAERIGHQQLVAWATACGKPGADDTDKLLEKPFSAAVVIEPGKNGYPPNNRIKAFLFSKDDIPDFPDPPVTKQAQPAGAWTRPPANVVPPATNGDGLASAAQAEGPAQWATGTPATAKQTKPARAAPAKQAAVASKATPTSRPAATNPWD